MKIRETSSKKVAANPPELFAYIDELRGVAVLLVVFVHTGFYFDETLMITKISRFGQYGVQLFFFLSAFTLCNSMSRLQVLESRDYLAFLVKRVFRIAPLYYIAAIGYTTFSLLSHKLFGLTPWTEPENYSALGFLTTITFTNGLSPASINQIVPGGWSIGCEFLFYLIFPLVFFGVRTRRGILALIIPFLIVCSYLQPAVLSYFGWNENPGNDTFVYYSILNQAPCFLLGMIYYHFKDRTWFFSLSITLTIAAGIFLLIGHERAHFWCITPTLAAMVFTGIVNVAPKFPRSNMLASVGRCSFSIYLVHFLITWAVGIACVRIFPELSGSTPVAVIATFIIALISYALSRISYRLVEQRFIASGRNFAKRITEGFSTPVL